MAWGATNRAPGGAPSTVSDARLASSRRTGFSAIASHPGAVGDRPAEIEAAGALRQDLVGIEDRRRIEDLLDASLSVQVGLGEEERHEIALFEPDPMFTRENPTNVYADGGELGGGRLDPVQHSEIG